MSDFTYSDISSQSSDWDNIDQDSEQRRYLNSLPRHSSRDIDTSVSSLNPFIPTPPDSPPPLKEIPRPISPEPHQYRLVTILFYHSDIVLIETLPLSVQQASSFSWIVEAYRRTFSSFF